jgi:hypothetical protein
VKRLRWLGKFWRAETGFFFALWFVLLVGGHSKLFRDPGTFWHTVIGDRILATAHFPETDSFSFTFHGRPWIAHQWLGECAMALLHRVAGLDTLLLASATLLAGLYAWAGARLLRAGLHWSLTAVLLFLAIGASASHFHIRPHLGTMLFLAISFAILCDVEAARAGMCRLWWLVPIFLLWTNTHGGMLGGWCTVALVFGHWSLSWMIGKPTPLTAKPSPVFPLRMNGAGVEGTDPALPAAAPPQSHTPLLLILLLLACGLTCVINPYGVRMPITWVEIMDSNVLPQIIIEHSPLRLGSTEGMMVLVFGAVYVFALLGLRPQWPRACWLVPLVWLALAISRIRHSPLFALTALLALADVLPHTRWAAWLAESGHDLFRFPSPDRQRGWRWRPLVLPALAVCVALILQWQGIELPVLGRGWAKLDSDIWPVDSIAALRECERDPDGNHRIFNEYAYGGFIIYYDPGLKVFVDDRCELYGDQWLLEFVRAEQEDTADYVEKFQKEYGFQLALTIAGSGYDEYFRTHADWAVLKSTPTATLYERRK